MHNIHETAEERTARMSEETVVAIDKNTAKISENIKAIKDLHSSMNDKSVEAAGFSGVIKSLKKNCEKIEQVKSAAVINNRILRKVENDGLTVSLKGVSVLTIKGDKGDKGDKPSSEELIGIIKPLIPPPEKGERGDSYVLTQNDKDEIARSIQVPIVEKVVEKTEIVREKPIEIVKEVALDEEPDTIVEKVNKSSKKIEPKQVKGLPAVIKFVNEYGSNPQGAYASGGANQLRILTGGTEVSAHVTEINFSDNITATYDGNGRVTLTSTSGVETPSGTVDGSNTTFIVTHTPVMVISDAGTYFSGAGYSYSSGTITMTSPPGSFIRSIY